MLIILYSTMPSMTMLVCFSLWLAICHELTLTCLMLQLQGMARDLPRATEEEQDFNSRVIPALCLLQTELPLHRSPYDIVQFCVIFLKLNSHVLFPQIQLTCFSAVLLFCVVSCVNWIWYATSQSKWEGFWSFLSLLPSLSNEWPSTNHVYSEVSLKPTS